MPKPLKTNAKAKTANDLFGASEPKGRGPLKAPSRAASAESGYTARDIEVLEGLEPVRRRPGMYIGGTDEKALHHLFAEVIDNAMDEALAGHASFIEVKMEADGFVTVTDNGRGIPVDPHPKFPKKSALEVIMCTLHSGGKFDSEVYDTSGGLHGVGVSVVNALSERLEVEVARGQTLYAQAFERGKPKTKLTTVGRAPNRRGTSVRFRPDPQIFGANVRFKPLRIFKMARSKAYLFGGVEIRWSCAPELLHGVEGVPVEETFRFPGGLTDFLTASIHGSTLVHPDIFAGSSEKKGGHGTVEWAIAWVAAADGFVSSYCNTIPTPEGGTHESGLRAALAKGLRDHAERMGQGKRAAAVTSEDVMAGAAAMFSLFMRDPEFQGQTKDRLASADAARIVEQAIRDPFDHWLAGSPNQANKLLEWVIERAEARARASQAVLPLRGKILNVASAGKDKLAQNQQLADLVQALGCGIGVHYRDEDLRYGKIIIMTDADVDGAHIASLLITFFYRQMPKLIDNGHLYLAVPPLYRLTHGAKTVYAKDDADKAALIEREFHGNAKVEIGRFKGLGEMMADQLRVTTMDPARRTLLRVVLLTEDREDTADSVERLMGTRAEARFAFIQERAEFAGEELLDV